MNVTRPARCLLSGRAAATMIRPTSVPVPACRAAFHATAQLNKRKPRFKNIKAADMGLLTPEKTKEFTEKTFPKYTPEEIEILRQRYTPEQMDALIAGEAAIDPNDLTIQGRLRFDPYRLPYLDDFSKHRPMIDKPLQDTAPPSPRSTLMSLREMAADTDRWLSTAIPEDIAQLADKRLNDLADQEFRENRAKEGLDPLEIEELVKSRQNARALKQKSWLDNNKDVEAEKYLRERNFLTHGSKTNTSAALDLGEQLGGVRGHFTAAVDPEDEGLDDLGVLQDTKKRTGMNIHEINQIECKIVVVRFVSNQTRLGKVQKAWAMAIAGNKDGRLGVADAKAAEFSIAAAKARLLAIQQMQPIRRYENRTTFGNVTGKFGSTIVEIQARPPGFGLRASHRLFEIFRICGMHDLAAKMPRGRNPMNSVKACVAALQSQKDPEELAIGRSKKLVDVRKVYYGGAVF